MIKTFSLVLAGLLFLLTPSFFSVTAGEGATNGGNVEKIRKFAEAGRATMQLAMGLMYANGSEGLARDPEAAAKWFRLAAEQGLPAAQHLLGQAFEYGEGVPKDLAEAVRWYRRAAAQGYKTSIRSLERHETPGGPHDPMVGIWSGTVTMPDVKIANSLVVELRLEDDTYVGQVTFDSVPLRVVRCGIHLPDRRGVLESEAAVLGKLMLGLEGHVGYDRWTGRFHLFDPAKRGESVLFDPEWKGGVSRDVFTLTRNDIARADLESGMGEYVRKLHEKAATGDTYAMFAIGMVFFQGQFNTPKSMDTALTWFVRSAEMGCPEAMTMLGTLHLQGAGVAKDRDKGIALLRQAADAGDDMARRSLEAIRAKEAETGDSAASPSRPATAKKGGMSELAKRGGMSSIARRDPLAGTWEGTYAEEGDGERFRLRIDTRAKAELLDEGVEMEIAEAYVKDGLATVRAGWTDDDGARRDTFFTGPIRDNGWEGAVVVTSGAEVFFQGAFTLKKR